MIEFSDIRLTFDNKLLFDGFNMKIEKGEKVLLRAPSGKGKTTLTKMLLGFVRQDSGEVILDEQVLSKDTVHDFRKKIAYVSQDVDLRKMTVEDLIEEIFSFKYNRDLGVEREQVLDLFAYFSLEEDLINKDIQVLSGGQRQRLGLVICILLNREVWILDEVTAGLDSDMKQRVVNFVLAQDKTCLIVSHDDIWLSGNSIRIEEW